MSNIAPPLPRPKSHHFCCPILHPPTMSKVALPPSCPGLHPPTTSKVASPPLCPRSCPSCHVQGRLTPFMCRAPLATFKVASLPSFPRLPASPPASSLHDKGLLISVKSRVRPPCHVQGHLCHVKCRPRSNVQGRPTHPISNVPSVDSPLACPTSPPT